VKTETENQAGLRFQQQWIQERQQHEAQFQEMQGMIMAQQVQAKQFMENVERTMQAKDTDIAQLKTLQQPNSQGQLEQVGTMIQQQMAAQHAMMQQLQDQVNQACRTAQEARDRETRMEQEVVRMRQ
jgi:hypothetical protein